MPLLPPESIWPECILVRGCFVHVSILPTYKSDLRFVCPWEKSGEKIAPEMHIKANVMRNVGQPLNSLCIVLHFCKTNIMLVLKHLGYTL